MIFVSAYSSLRTVQLIKIEKKEKNSGWDDLHVKKIANKNGKVFVIIRQFWIKKILPKIFHNFNVFCSNLCVCLYRQFTNEMELDQS